MKAGVHCPVLKSLPLFVSWAKWTPCIPFHPIALRYSLILSSHLTRGLQSSFSPKLLVLLIWRKQFNICTNDNVLMWCVRLTELTWIWNKNLFQGIMYQSLNLIIHFCPRMRGFLSPWSLHPGTNNFFAALLALSSAISGKIPALRKPQTHNSFTWSLLAV